MFLNALKQFALGSTAFAGVMAAVTFIKAPSAETMAKHLMIVREHHRIELVQTPKGRTGGHLIANALRNQQRLAQVK